VRKILLVGNNGDERPALLKALTSPTHEWDLDWISGGQMALEQLSRTSYDAIICHMDLPGLSGVNLLEIVRKHYPQIIRFMLSEATTTENQYKTAGTAHQILPLTNQKSFVDILQRSFALNNLLAQPELKRLVLKLRNLPSLPSLYTDMMAEIESSEASLERIGSIISQDPAMSAKILQLINSPFFGLSRSVVSPTQAATLLGIDIIRGLVLCINVFSQFNPLTLEKLGISSLWEHSARVGSYAKIVAREEHADKKSSDYAFTGGVLHDIGKLVLADNLPVQYFSALGTSARKEVELFETEKDIFGATHAQVGAYLLGLWGLPQPIVEAVAFHHTPIDYPESIFNPVTAVHAANYIEHQRHPAHWTRKTSLIQASYIEQMGLTNRINVWVNACN
jgi:HD-like signal output (HDOD) protein